MANRSIDSGGRHADVAEDILVKRFSGNPKLWGIVLTVLGAGFLLQTVFNLRGLMRGFLPLMLIGLGIYILRGYVFKPKAEESRWNDFASARRSETFVSGSLTEQRFRTGEFENRGEARFGGWRGQ